MSTHSTTLAKAVLFDLDGTLVDSLGDLAASANAVLQRNGHPEHPVDAYRHFIGDGARKLVERAVPAGTTNKAIDDLLAEYLVEYAANVGGSTCPFDGIADLVSTLADRGVPMGVATNKPHELTLPCLDHCFPSAPFGDAVCGARAGLPSKPAPDALLEVAQKLGVDPANCLFVGDSGVDMESAVAAGMVPVAVLWGMRGREELTAAGALHFVEHPREILDFVE